jgi:Protein of unknown function (DUF4245)
VSDPVSGPAEEPAGGRGGRYQRSFAGMIGAMLITLVVIGAFVAFRALNRDELEQRPEAVDYLETVQLVQEAGVSVVYPPTLPEGWIATSVDYTPGERPQWGLGLLTDDEQFAGVRQEDAALDDLLATYVDEQTSELDDAEIPGSVAHRWQVFEDEGGDLAFAAEVGDDWVLVYGSASRDDLESIVKSLTTDPV